MNRNKKVSDKRLLLAAYHQAGHTVAYLLTNRPFDYVTIRPDSDTLGYIQPSTNDWFTDLKSKSFYKPSCLMIFFENSFISISGFITEKIFGFTNNSVAAQLDLQSLVNVTLADLPGKLITNYQRFILQYTKEVLQKHWTEISMVAEALYEKKTLTYNQVQKVIREKLKKESKIIN